MAFKETKHKPSGPWNDRFPENGLRHIKIAKGLNARMHRCHAKGSRDSRTKLAT